MTLGASISKTTSAWAVGSTNGGLDTGSIAASTWYHAYLIKRPDTGVVDVLVSLSATSPTMPTNYTLKRRIGSMKTNGSSQWTLFTQLDDEFLWDIPAADVAAVNSGTAAVTRTLTVPTGIKVIALIGVFPAALNDSRGYVSSLDSADQAVIAGNINFGGIYSGVGATLQYSGNYRIRTNTSAQIRTRLIASDGNNTLTINTQGWVDTRGRL